MMMNDSHYPIPQVLAMMERYTACDIKRADSARRFQKITGQPINRILHAVDNNIQTNLPILRVEVRMYEDIYGLAYHT